MKKKIQWQDSLEYDFWQYVDACADVVAYFFMTPPQKSWGLIFRLVKHPIKTSKRRRYLQYRLNYYFLMYIHAGGADTPKSDWYNRYSIRLWLLWRGRSPWSAEETDETLKWR